jgi:hypothetical protein
MFEELINTVLFKQVTQYNADLIIIALNVTCSRPDIVKQLLSWS